MSIASTPRRGRAWRLSALLAGLAVILAACSTNDSTPAAGDATSTTATAAETDAPSTTTATAPADGATSEEIQLEVGDYVFDAIVAGPEDGPVIFMLHGFPQTNQSWADEIPVLADAGYRVVAPNLRGYSPGARPLDPELYAMPELVGDVLGMADALGVDQFNVVGHDWGAMVAWNLGIDHPDRVLSLVAVSVPHPAAFAMALNAPVDPADDEPSQSDQSGYMAVFAAPEAEAMFLDNDAAFLRGIYSGPGFTADEVQAYVDHFSAEGAMVGPLNWYRGATSGISIGPVTVPTMYIWSTDDVALGRTGAELAGDFVEGPYRFEILDGVSHWIPDEAPDELNALLLDFFSTYA